MCLLIFENCIVVEIIECCIIRCFCYVNVLFLSFKNLLSECYKGIEYMYYYFLIIKVLSFGI